MATTAELMENNVATDISDDKNNIKRKLKFIRDKATGAMFETIGVYSNLTNALHTGNQALQLGNEGLEDLANVLRSIAPSSSLSRELRRIQADALKSNEEGNLLIAELGQCKAKLSICKNYGTSALANLDAVIKSLGCTVHDAATATVPTENAGTNSVNADKKIAAENDIRRKLEAIRDKATRAMALAAEIATNIKKSTTITAEGLKLGDEGLDQLKEVLRTLDPGSTLAQELRDIQKQALDCNTSGNFVMASIGNCAAHASVCRNVGEAALASLEAVITNLPHIIENKPTILAFSTPAIVAAAAATPIPTASASATPSADVPAGTDPTTDVVKPAASFSALV